MGLKIARYIGQFRQFFQSLHKSSGIAGQFVRVWIFEAVLVLRSADDVLHRKILDGLHIKRGPVDLLQLRLQPPDDIRCVGIALLDWLEINLYTAGVQRSVGAIDSNE